MAQQLQMAIQICVDAFGYVWTYRCRTLIRTTSLAMTVHRAIHTMMAIAVYMAIVVCMAM